MIERDRKSGAELSTIAMFIAAALQHPRPPCNAGHGKPISTISVQQHKVKWGEVCVYCTLADPELLKQAPAFSRPNSWFEAMKHDAAHYRRCYLWMLELVPQHRDAILGRADHGYLLLPDAKALSDWVAENSVAPNAGGQSYVERIAEQWSTTQAGLLDALQRLYATP